MIQHKVKINNMEMSYYAIENKRAKNLFIYLNGMNGQVDTITFFKHKIFEENVIVTFDNIAHGDNKIKHTKKFKKYLDFTVKMIKAIKTNPAYQGMKIIIMGESFGASQTIALSQFYPELADLFFCWNAPTKSVLSSRIKFKDAFNYILTSFFNIETYTMMGLDETMTSNQEILAIRKERGLFVKTSNKLIVAALSTIKPNRKLFDSKSLPKKLVYIQSKEDIMCDFNLEFDQHKNVHILNKGKHVLSFEPEAKEMFVILEKEILK
ncbi:MAG: hypothetical protein ACRC4L_00315 [Mycoplasma sp.]